jgi:hypothetical protein
MELRFTSSTGGIGRGGRWRGGSDEQIAKAEHAMAGKLAVKRSRYVDLKALG